MARKKTAKKTVILEGETKPPATIFSARQAGCDHLCLIDADYFTIEAEYDGGKVALFYDEDAFLVAALRDWVEIRKIDAQTVKELVSAIKKAPPGDFGQLFESLARTAKSGELPEGFGNVNGQKF